MDRKEKEKRSKMVEDYIKNKPKDTQNQIKDYLKENSFKCSQTTISRIIDELNYELTDDGYQKKEDEVEKEKRKMLEELFKHHSPSIGLLSDAKILKIKTRIGTENTLGFAIYDLYEKNLSGVLPGIGCVFVIFKKDKNAKSIYRALKSYAKGESKRIVINEDDDISE